LLKNIYGDSIECFEWLVDELNIKDRIENFCKELIKSNEDITLIGDSTAPNYTLHARELLADAGG